MNYSEFTEKAAKACTDSIDSLFKSIVSKDESLEPAIKEIKDNYLDLILSNFAMSAALAMIFDKLNISEKEANEQIKKFCDNYRESFKGYISAAGIPV